MGGVDVRVGRAVRAGLMGAVVAAGLCLAGCASAPTPAPPALVPLPQALADANAAHAAGDQAKAMSILDLATRQHPASPEPWLRMAQIQFDVGNYGPAITHAKEVLQRDLRSDPAQSLIAVSGLRSSAAALAALRARAPVMGTTRTEAEVLAARIRDSLREPVLVPSPTVAPEPEPPPPRRRITRPVPTGRVPGASVPSVPAAPSPTQGAGGDPFRLLKQTP